MKSIKPGRGPSLMGGFAGVAAAVFGLLWTSFAAMSGAPVTFTLFGVVFVILAAGNAVYEFRNATGKNRHSVYDITDADEEPDPLEFRFRGESVRADRGETETGAVRYCPWCGAKLNADFAYCGRCGKKLPEL